jgi:hypothetical protein
MTPVFFGRIERTTNKRWARSLLKPAGGLDDSVSGHLRFFIVTLTERLFMEVTNEGPPPAEAPRTLAAVEAVDALETYSTTPRFSFASGFASRDRPPVAEHYGSTPVLAATADGSAGARSRPLLYRSLRRAGRHVVVTAVGMQQPIIPKKRGPPDEGVRISKEQGVTSWSLARCGPSIACRARMRHRLCVPSIGTVSWCAIVRARRKGAIWQR